jgi:hypothetical protein
VTYPPRIARTVLRGKRAPNLRRKASHLAFIRLLPCVACGIRPIQGFASDAAHIRTATDGYSGGKPSDRYTLPLCRACHTRQHSVGEVTFFAALRIDPLDAASALWTHSGNLEAGERIVFRARQAIGLRM